ncbi:MAG: hypothetical protein FJ090_17770 [Deltaproteobacteria bacterium]|nr:hypothetical protein [Deltaproteobacteria bacterium]
MLRLLLPLALLAAPAGAAGLRYAEDQAPPILNPIFGSTMPEARANELIFESLFTDNLELATTPALAESFEVSPDRAGMTVTLRSDAIWHDGKPVTADDVVFTIQAMKDKGTASTEAGRVAWIAEATATDARTVAIRFVRPESRPEEKLFFKILPRHGFSSTVVKRTDPFKNRPIGSGPYMFSSFNEDNSITFQKNGSWRDSVGIGELTMREVADKNYQAKLILYESLEALVRVLPRDLAMLQNNRKVELYPYQTNSWWYIGFNEARAPFDKTAVRQGLAQLVDVGNLLAPVGTGDLLSGPFVKSSPYYNHDVRPPPNDARAAGDLLTSAGWAKNGEYWTRDGHAVAMTLVAHQALESAQEIAVNLQSQLQTAGIKLNVDFLDDAAWRQRVWRDRDFDLVLSQWTFDRNEDIREQFHSLGSRNFVGYRSPEVDLLLDKARDSLDPFARKTALRQVHAKVAADQPMVFLWTLDSYAALSVRVKNVVVHPFYFFTFAPQWQLK